MANAIEPWIALPSKMPLHSPQIPTALLPAMELCLNSSSAASAKCPGSRGVDWFVFPSVTLRNTEKLKCESFMLHERRGQHASQQRNSERALFPGLMVRASEDFVLNGALQGGGRGANTNFLAARTLVSKGQDQLWKGLFMLGISCVHTSQHELQL